MMRPLRLYRSIVTCWIFLVAVTSFAQPVSAPDFRCTAVAPNGDVTLSWIIPPDPGGNFVAYEIYGSSTGIAGPYNLLGNVPVYLTNSFIHVGAAANVTTWSYYITTSYNPGPAFSNPSDTLRSILLNVANPVNGTANLSWNPVSSPLPPTSLPPYTIDKEVGGNWSVAGSTNGTTFRDTISVCNAQVNYQIVLPDASGCSSISNIDGDVFQDQIGPAVTVIDSVSFDCATGDLLIGWQPNPSPDVYYYNFFQYNNTSLPPWVKEDSLAAFPTFASVNGLSGCGGTFSLAAYDTCGFSGLLAAGHQAMCLSFSFDDCSREANLTWTAYRGWSGVSEYKIYMSENSGPYQLASTVSGSDTTVNIAGLATQSTYCFYVRAVASGTGFTSSSNCICFFTQGPVVPLFHALEYVTVTPDSTVELLAIVDTAASVKSYRIERADNDGSYFFRHQVPMGQLTSTQLLWEDDSVEVNSKTHSYRIIAIDSCGLGVDTSNIGRTILLKGETGPGFWENTIYWSPYINWPFGVSEYEVYRGINGVFSISPDIFVFPGNLSVTENVEDFFEADGEVCYNVRAQESPGDGTLSGSRSNTVCIPREPLVWIPNAFTPGGRNPVFRPRFAFVDHDGYEFSVFDRWGQVIFKTHDVQTGWDGLVGGQKAPSNVYVYQVRWRAANGEEYRRAGHFTLLGAWP